MNTEKRIVKIRKFMKKNDVRFCIILNPLNQFYISGFKAIVYSRPIVLGVGDDKTYLVVPGLEENHAKAHSTVDEVYCYYEHPEKEGLGTTYMYHLDKIISKYPVGAKIGVEFNTMPTGLAEHLKSQGYELIDVGIIIAEMRFVKEKEEIETMIESGKLVSLALKESLRNARAGITEMELDQFGNKVLFEDATMQYPEATLDFFVMSPSGLTRSIMPHVFSNTRKLQKNDIVIHSRQVGLNGYRAECERTFFIGKPNEKQKEIFNLVVEAQQVALDIIKPGVKAKEVDLATRKIFEEAGYSQYCIHRAGHGIGVGFHEEPYLRFDSDLILKEGMVFSIEPGIYIPEIGGFRHSDTVILTENGNKVITEYPRELNDLIF